MAEVIVDSSCLINLYATDIMESILPALGMNIHVSRAVLAESLFLWRVVDEERIDDSIDLGPALASGLIRSCDVESTSEVALFVQLAAEIDDGEASCLAIAKARGWTLATDDRKALRLAREQQVSLLTTPDLMKRWADASKVDDREVAEALNKIQRHANFIPRRSSEWFEWWSRVASQHGY